MINKHCIATALLLLASLIAPAAAQTVVTVSAGQGQARAGQLVTVPITVAGDFAALQADLVFDTTKLSLDAFTPASQSPGMNVDFVLIEPGHLRVVVYDSTCPVQPFAAAPGGGPTALGSLRLRINADAGPGLTTIDLRAGIAADQSATAETVQLVDGQVEILAGGGTGAAAKVPALGIYGLLAAAVMLLLAGVLVRRRRGIHFLLLLMTLAALLAGAPINTGRAAGSIAAAAPTPVDIVNVILERQPVNPGDDCNHDNVVDALDVICARNANCASNQNLPPVIQPIAAQSVLVGASLSLQVQASDPNPADTLSYSLTTAPAAMTITGASGSINWMPGQADIGVHPVSVQVSDNHGLSASTSFSITVQPAASATLQLAAPGNFSVDAGTALSLTLYAASSNPTSTIGFSKVAGPANLVVAASSGLVTWPTSTADLGNNSVRVRAEDQNGLFDEQVFTVRVITAPDLGSLPNRAPVLAAIAAQSVNAGQALQVQASATDPDGDALTFSLPAAPAGMVINNNGLITFTPAAQQAGSQQVSVRVSDTLNLSDTTQFKLTVVGPNHPPVAIDDAYVARRGQTLSVPAPGVLGNDTDPDNDPLSAILNTGPGKGVLDFHGDGSFDFTPDNPTGTLGIKLKWTYQGRGGIPDKTPMIIDLDGDGIPEIVSMDGVQSKSEIYAVHGDTGAEYFRVPYYNELIASGTSFAAADIDLDGHPEIIVIGREPFRGQQGKKLIAFDHTGQIKWISEPLPDLYATSAGLAYEGNMQNASITIADIDQDGTPEILVGIVTAGLGRIGYQVWDNQGNKLDYVYTAGSGGDSPSSRVEVVDLDLDGVPEIVMGPAAWTRDGQLLWSHPDFRLDFVSDNLYPLVANLDDDPYPELVVASGRYPLPSGTVIAWNHDGSTLWQQSYSAGYYGTFATLSIADVDNDGKADILLPPPVDGSTFRVLNGADGTLKWSATAPGSGAYSGTSGWGATVMDMDNDGHNEVVYLDGARTFHIWDGRDGSIKLEIPSGESGGGFQSSLPIFADVDGDGHAELVTIGDYSLNPDLIRVYESPQDDWPPMRALWNQNSYHVTNINDDGTVPQFERAFWLLPGLNQNLVNQRSPAQQFETYESFTYRASDGSASDDATVYIRVLDGGNPPQILSRPDTSATVGFDYRYAPITTDADAGDTLVYSLVANPAGMSIDAGTGLIRWAPDTIGDYQVGVLVTDSQQLTDLQTWTLTVGEPVTVPDVVGQTRTTAGSTLSAVHLQTGYIRLRSDPLIPADQVAEQNPIAGAVAEYGGSVALTVSTGPAPADRDDDGDGFSENQGDCNDNDATTFPGANDSEGDGVDQNCDGVDGELALDRIALSPAAKTVLTGDYVQFSGNGIHADGSAVNINGLGTWASTAPTIASVDGKGRAKALAAGNTTITLTHTGVTGSAALTVIARIPSDDTPPTAVISTPSTGDEVTAPIDVIGTANDTNLLRWELGIDAGDDSDETLLASGSSAVANGVLGQLDPTLLLNGIQTLTLRVFDRGGNVTEARVTVTASGNFKVGNFTLTFEDLNVSLADLPITVTRKYDSRDKRRGDFGIGWNLGLNTVDVRANRVLGTGWEALKGGNSFQLHPTDAHMISVTLPGGEVETFDVRVSPSSSFLLPFSFVTVSLVPTGTTLGQLTMLDNPNLLVIDSQPGPVELLDDSSFDVFNPQRFRYVAPNGVEFVVNRTSGLETFTDANGNRLTFSANAITHSNGTQVRFERDATGRITRVTDPVGNVLSYAYDGNGNLATQTDAEGNVTRFRYNAAHGILQVIDPSGNRAVRNEYDDDGRLTAIVDAAGNRVEFTHNIAGNEELIRDANGHVQRLISDDKGNVLLRENTVTIDGVPAVASEQFEYDERNNEIVHIDADGVRTEFTYDANDNVLSTVVDPGGLAITTSSTWNDKHSPLTQTDALGRVTTNSYDDHGNLLTITDPAGNTQHFVYASGGRLASRTDVIGTTTTYSYDNRNMMTGEDVTAADGSLLGRKSYTYDNSGRKTSESDYRVINGSLTPLTTSFAYDGNGRMIRRTDAQGNVSRTEYDASGKVAAQIDALGRRTEFRYSPRGQRVQTTYADAGTTSQSYDARGNLVSQTDELGRITTFEYDELNRKVASAYPDGAHERDVLSAGGRLIASIDALGNRTQYQYDAAGRRTKTIAPAVTDARDNSTVNPTTSQAYDAAGNVVARTDANGNTTTISYDVLNKPLRTDYADGSFVTQSFDAAGRVTTSTDELGRVTQQSFDGAGRLLSVTQPAPAVGQPQPVTRYTWDLTGNRLTQTDALGHVTRLAYDKLGHQIQRTLPGGQTATASYDAVGNRVTETDFNGQTIASTFDARNRLTTRTLPDGKVQSFSYSASGARQSATDSAGTQTFEHDARDRTTAIVQTDGSRLQYSFDAAGRLTAASAPAKTISYAYDALDRITQVSSPDGNTTYGYAPNGAQVLITRPNGTVTQSSFDTRNRNLAMVHRDAQMNVLESFTNTYLANGQRESVTQTDGSVETYAYDALNRLVTEIRVGTTPRTIRYVYDAVGNRLSVDANGVTTSYAYDDNNRMLSAGSTTYTYDANGNRTSVTVNGATTLLDWTSTNQLAAVSGADGQATYGYDVDGHRTLVESATGTQHFLVDPQNPTGQAQVAETRDGAGDLKASYTYGTDLIAANNGTAHYFHTDAHGSTRLLTNPGGQATDSYAYDGYGKLTTRTGSSSNDYLYAGEQFDRGADAYYLRARYYDPSAGVLLSRDPITGTAGQPTSQQPYLYAAADPINNLDPSGQESLAELSVVQGIQSGLSVFAESGQVCTAVSTTKTVANLASLAGIGLTLLTQPPPPPFGKYSFGLSFPATVSPLKSLGYEYAGSPSGRDYKVIFKFEEGKGKDISGAVSFDAHNKVTKPFTMEVSGSEGIKLVKLTACGVEVAKISAKLETADRAGIGSSGDFSGVGFAGSTIGVNTETRGFLEFKAGPLILEQQIFTLRLGGSNAGLFLGLDNRIF